MRQFRQFNEAASSGGKREYKRSERRSSDGPKRSFGRLEGRAFSKSSRPEGRSFDRRDSDRPRSRNTGIELHRVICARCGESCEVPFRPTNSKPVYCRDCFKKNESSEGEKFAPKGRSDRSEPRASASSYDLEKINNKLDKIMRALNIE